MKFRIIALFVFLSSLLFGCGKESIKTSTDNIIVFVSEEEQYELSDLVYVVKAGSKGKVETIGNYKYTIYFISVLQIIKGDKEINHVHLFGDTTDSSSVSTSIDETMKENETYKIYLKEKDGKYFTTAGYQSIIKQ